MKKAIYWTLCFFCFGIALYAIGVYALTPLGSLLHPDMKRNFMAHRGLVYTHIFCSAVALLIGPFQFSEKLRNSKPQLHRWMGRVYLTIGVLLGGVAGFFMAATAYGGQTSSAGFGLLAALWLYTGARAYFAIRKGQVHDHRKWMIRNFSLTLAAVSLRLYLPLSFVFQLNFDVAYPIISWLCWVPNLIVAEWFFNRRLTE